jgi:plasmid stability protein
MRQMTVRGIPDELDAELRARSRRDHTSLNRTVVRMLKQAAGMGNEASVKRRDLSSMAGSWSQAEADEFDGHVEAFEALDEELWK